MTGPTIGEALRHAAFHNRLTLDQARAVASILVVLEVVDGGGSPIPPGQAAALLDTVANTYRAELGRLSRVYGDGGDTRTDAAAARRRADVAARRAVKATTAVDSNNVVSLRPEQGTVDTD